MDKLVQQNPLLSPPSSNPSGTAISNLISTPLSPPSRTSPIHSAQSHPTQNSASSRLSETSEVVVYPSSVSLRVCINKKRFT